MDSDHLEQTIFAGSDGAELAEILHRFPLPHGVVSNGRPVIFVVAEPWHTTDWSIDFGFLVRELRQRGHPSGVVCTQVVGAAQDYPTFAVPAEAMARVDFWKPWQLHQAVVMTWLLRGTAQVQALHDAGVFVVSKGDSDGLEGMRVHPGAQLNRMWHRRKTLPHRLEGVYMLAKKYVCSHRKEDALLLSNVQNADVTLLEAETARQEFAQFVRWAGSDAESRLKTLPSPVSTTFLDAPLPARKDNHVVAIGRWDDAQKDAPLLVQALALFSGHCPESRVTVIGGGGEAVFAEITRQHPQIRYLGRIPHSEIVGYLQTARSIVFSSRWEGTPVSANEMLTLGGTIVAPATLTGLRGQITSGPFGTLAKARTGTSLARALRDEMTAWDSGKRDLVQIAAHWRPQFTANYLVDALLGYAESATQSRVQSVPT